MGFRWVLVGASLSLAFDAHGAAPREVSAAATLLEWDAPAACPDVAMVYQRLSDVLGRVPQNLGAFRRARGVIVEAEDGWQLTLVLSDGARQRSRLIRAASCTDLGEAAAVAIALALDESSEPIEQPAFREPSRPAPEELGADPSTTDPGALQLEATIGAALDWSALPTVAPGGSVAGRLRWGASSLGLSATLLPSSVTPLGAGRSADFALFALQARACRRAFEAGPYAAACLGFEAGEATARGDGLSDARRAQSPWLGPTAALEIGMPIWNEFGLELGAEAIRPLVRRAYVINAGELVYRAPGVTSRLQLSVVWRAY